MLIRTFDVETTGFPPDAALCEVAWCDTEVADADSRIHHPVSWFCNPGRPMPPEARAIHHIGDAELIDAPPPDVVIRKLNDPAVDVWCAHNAAFEREFFTGCDKPWICTLKVARRLWPDCPSHSNQCLRYFLRLNLPEAEAMPPHRAGPDAFVTAHILKAALGLATVDNMIQWTAEPSLLPRITFGKHRGSKWADVPADYLEWCLRQDMDADVKFTCRHHLRAQSGRLNTELAR